MAFSLASVAHSIGVSASFFIVSQIVLMYCVHLTKSKALCWAVSILFLVLLNHGTGTPIKDFMVLSDSREEYLLAVTISWINCRCLSFCMVQCDRPEEAKEKLRTYSGGHEIVLVLSYCLYFPLLFSGPLFMYDDFKRDLYHPSLDWPVGRICSSLLAVARYAFWFVFMEFALHYAYLSALNYHSVAVDRLPLWSLSGLGYGMCQLFMVKYTVFYGLASTVAGMEGFAVASKPKCISRIHLYSDMWKYFDFGLYTFLKRYIYTPVIKDKPSSTRKFCAGAICFAFVYVWHGTSERILLWAALNFVALTIEKFGFHVATTRTVQLFKNRHLSPMAARRLKALLVAVLLMMSSVSNFCFICGVDVANAFVKNIVLSGQGWPLPAFVALGFLYCMCHVSEEVKHWETKRMI